MLDWILTNRAKIVATTVLLLVFNLLLFRPFHSGSLVLFLSALNFSLIMSFWKGLVRRATFLQIFVILELLFATTLLTRDFGLNTVLVAFGWLFLTATFLFLLAAQKTFFTSLVEVFLSPLHLFKAYFAILVVWPEWVAEFLRKLPLKIIRTESETLKRLLFGGLAALFLSSIVFFLLSGADQIFAKTANDFFLGMSLWSFLRMGEPAYRLLYSTLFLVLLVPIWHLKTKNIEENPVPTQRNLTLEMGMVLASLSVLLGVFLFISYPYVFATVSEAKLHQFGVATYSEYVKRGFGELILVSLIVYSTLMVGYRIFKNQKNLLFRKIILGLQVILAFEFFIFILSIFRRVWLYQEAHGLSVTRIYGGVFLVFLAVCLGILILRHLIKKSLPFWSEFLVGAVFFSFLAIFNTEHFIATVHPPTVNGRVDYVYMSSLSADGFVGWKKGFVKAKETLLGMKWEDLKGQKVLGCEKMTLWDGYKGQKNLMRCEKKELVSSLSDEGKREIQYAGMITANLLENYRFLTQKYGTKEDQKNFVTTLGIKKEINEFEFDSRAWNFHRFDQDFSPNMFVESQSGLREKDFLDQALAFNWSQKKAYENLLFEIPLEDLKKMYEAYQTYYWKVAFMPVEDRKFEMDISRDSAF